MQYRKIHQHTDITNKVQPEILEIEKGHRYLVGNRYTEGFEDINFLRLMTYKEMIENNLPEDFINAQVPLAERDCESCKYYIVSEGIFTQDVAAVLVKRLNYQMDWLPNGFYETAKRHAEQIIASFGRYEQFRAKFGFYHVPFDKKKFITTIYIMDEVEVLQSKSLIDEFLSNAFAWQTKEELITELKK